MVRGVVARGKAEGEGEVATSPDLVHVYSRAFYAVSQAREGDVLCYR